MESLNGQRRGFKRGLLNRPRIDGVKHAHGVLRSCSLLIPGSCDFGFLFLEGGNPPSRRLTGIRLAWHSRLVMPVAAGHLNLTANGWKSNDHLAERYLSTG